MTEPKMAGVMPWMAGWLAAEGLPLLRRQDDADRLHARGKEIGTVAQDNPAP